MTRDDVATAIEWAAAEGWNPGLHDAACFRAADPGGFLAGVLDDRVIATLSVVRYGASYGFLGLYIVERPHRGKGFGMKLWNAGLDHLGGRTVGLDGVLAQQANYRRSGFRFAHRNVRYAGRASGGGGDDSRIVPLSAVPLATLAAYDAAIFGVDRTDFLRAWVSQPDATAIGSANGGRLDGYAVMRRARAGFKVGPLFADDPEIARALFARLAKEAPPGATLYLDVAEPNRDAVALAERCGMSIVFETARMYAGPAMDLPIDRVFGVTTFELG